MDTINQRPHKVPRMGWVCSMPHCLLFFLNPARQAPYESHFTDKEGIGTFMSLSCWVVEMLQAGFKSPALKDTVPLIMCILNKSQNCFSYSFLQYKHTHFSPCTKIVSKLKPVFSLQDISKLEWKLFGVNPSRFIRKTAQRKMTTIFPFPKLWWAPPLVTVKGPTVLSWQGYQAGTSCSFLYS